MKKCTFFLFFISLYSICQDVWLTFDEKEPKNDYVFATWKTYRLGNAQTTETVKKNHLEYRIMHRFGNMVDKSKTFNQLAHTAFGLDNVNDVRIGLDYGILDNLTLGVGRSRYNELLDFSFKWCFLKQTTQLKNPVTLALFSSVGYTTMNSTRMYFNVINKNFKTQELHRLTYVTQLILARKLTKRLSVEILPTWYHKNFVVLQYNDAGVANNNSYFLLGTAARYKLNNRLVLFFDYFYNFHPYFKNNKTVYMPFTVGCELETGGHVFTLFWTNANAIVENNFLEGSKDSWNDLQIKFSFCISRTFSFKKD